MIPVIYRNAAGAMEARADDPRSLLTNRKGWYLALGAPNRSNYDGLYVPVHGEYWKTLWNILPDGGCTGMEIDEGIVRKFPDAEQRFLLCDAGLTISSSGSCTVTLDCKKRFDESENDRQYTIVLRGPHDARAGKDTLAKVTLAHVRYASPRGTIFMCIATTMAVSRIDRWRPVEYAYDVRRGTRSTQWVYDALRLSGQGRIAVCAGEDPKSCEQSAISLLVRPDRGSPSARFPMPAEIAWRALSALRTEKGILAGLPWFSDAWSRDELIAAGGLLAAGEHEEVMGIVERWLCAIRMDGTLPAIYPAGGLRSADAQGLLGKRILDLLRAGKISPDRAARWLPAAKRLALAYDVRDGMAWSGPKETWMDTDPGGEGRAGARIEIQALCVALHDAVAGLAQKAGIPVPGAILERRRAVANSIRARLVSAGALLDGLHPDGSPDKRTRPNAFLAWYACPSLFSDPEWAGFFRHAVRCLWLPWGGLATLDPSDPEFISRDRGEDSAAYHNGDSWFFVNNICAMALHCVAPQEFGSEVSSLLKASMRDLCSEGFLGHASEISSAQGQEAMGCHAQAWSASTLVEALLKVKTEEAL